MVTFYKRMKLNGALKNQSRLDFLDDYDTTEIYDARWLEKNRKGKFIPGIMGDEDSGYIHPSAREKLNKINGWKKIFRWKHQK